MTKKFVQDGQTIMYTNTTGAAIASGALVKMSHTIGVALVDIPIGGTGAVGIDGVYKVTKVAGTAWAQGEKLVYKTASNSIAGSGSAVVAGDVTGAAIAFEIAASADVIGYAKLTPGNATLT